MSTNLNRRIFLRGLGGAVVAAPFLSSVFERTAKGQSAAPPKQLIVMFTHYGCVTTKWFPAKSHGALAASDLMATNLNPLAPYVNKLLIPRGIRSMNEWTASNNGKGGRGQGNDPHTQVVGTYFTCQPVVKNSNDPFSFSQDTKFQARPIGSSLDNVIAQQLSPNGEPLFMRVGNQAVDTSATANTMSVISYVKPDGAAPDAPANIYPGVGLPSQVFSAITGLFKQGTAMTPDSYAAIRGKSVLDLVKDDLETLKRFDMSQDDKRKLDAWETLLNSTGTIVASAQCNQDLATMLGATTANINATGRGGLGADVLTTKVTNDLDGADMYSVVAALAAACNYNPVIFLKYPGNYVFSGLFDTSQGEQPEESHALSHRLDNAGMQGSCYAHALTMLQKIDLYYAKKFAKLLSLLDGIQEGNGSTLLDNTATVWFQEMSDGNAHNLNNIPIIHAGSCGGYFKTGWTINVDGGAANLTTGNSESQCADGSSNQMSDGISQGTGTPAQYANAPINKYFCNLMNALGVKADANGNPQKGGTAPVSRFGYSDLTTDFCGGYGAVSGATIHKPGEYTELKA